MKKWFIDLKIKNKLNLIMLIALMSLVFLGIISHYFLNTSHVVSVILNGERRVNVAYYTSIQLFYRYLATNDKDALDKAYNYLDEANKLTAFFGDIDDILAETSNEEFVDRLYVTYKKILKNREIAELLASRIFLLHSINNTQFRNSIEAAKNGVENGRRLKEVMSAYLESPNEVMLQELERAIERMVFLENSFAESIEEINQFAKRLLFLGLIASIFILGGIIILLIRYISMNITRPSNLLLKIVNKLAVGDLTIKIDIKAKDEIGQLADSIQQMKLSMEETISHANKIAKGNYSAKLQPRSDKDELVNSLNAMTKSLKETTDENTKQNWLKTGMAELNNRMRGEQEQVTLAQNIISFLAEYLNTQIGGIYLNSHNSTFDLVGSYAFTKRKNLSNQYKKGEGIIGQAALEKKPILISNIPDDYVKINSGLGEASPKNILAVPFVYEGDVKGVIELGSFQEFTEQQIEFLDQASENIAINFNTAESRSRLQELLEKSQQQAEELQTQQEEHRQTNEELEEQAKYLKESEAKLQAQQEELRQTNEELEEKTQSLEEQKEDIRNKNKELENAQNLLEERAKQLEITSKYKSEFLANMSHELRTPLNSLLILSKILFQNKDKNLTDKQVEFANTIHAAGTELLNIINEILDLAKVESGKLELNVEHVDLKECAQDIEKNYRHLIEEKGLKFRLNLDDKLPESIRTDEQRVKQVIKNFLSNAIKFTEKGSITIDFTKVDKNTDLSNSGLNPSDAVAISVNDTGKGISKEKQQLIFEAFQQEDGTTSRKYGGTGLGLSIAKEMAHLLGGEIQLKSEAGKGSTFTFYFSNIESTETIETGEAEFRSEIYKASKPDTDPEQSTEVPDNGKDEDFSGGLDDRKIISKNDRTILIIEDDVKFAKILIEIGHEKNFKCLIAKTGKRGLGLAEEYKPDAIILDIGLPDIDGWTVMQRLKDNSETRHIPVHFMSASDKSMEALRMGAIGFLSKPVSMEGLEEAFNKIEEMISKTIKNLLVVEDDEKHSQSIIELIGNNDVHSTATGSGKEAFELLKTNKYDCMILDLGLKDISGFELLQMIESEKAISHIPIIIYTGKEISRQEESKLKKHAESIIIKGVRSQDRLFDEVTLFLHRVEKNLPEEKQRILRMIHDKDQLFQNKKILLVDDDMRNVFAISNLLEERGMKAVIAKNGREGLKLLDENKDVDLVLMDIMMPEMDGYEAMRRIRKDGTNKKIPIIALTAKAMKGDRTKCIEAGANDYLSKPVDNDKLLSMLRVWLYR